MERKIDNKTDTRIKIIEHKYDVRKFLTSLFKIKLNARSHHNEGKEKKLNILLLIEVILINQSYRKILHCKDFSCVILPFVEKIKQIPSERTLMVC